MYRKSIRFMTPRLACGIGWLARYFDG